MIESLLGLLRTEPEAVTQFAYIDPPFNFNHPDFVRYPPEVSGHYLMQSLRRRLGWTSFKGKRLLDFGCGVRFSRTIVNLYQFHLSATRRARFRALARARHRAFFQNARLTTGYARFGHKAMIGTDHRVSVLGIDIGLYCGVDVNAQSIAWLKANVQDPRLRFEHLDMYNPLYNAAGAATDDHTLERLGLTEFDAVCMFSVITHQAPQQAAEIFSMLYPCVSKEGRMYFTAFVDQTADKYVERDPASPGHLSTYSPERMLAVLETSGWVPLDVYPASPFQQTVFVCRK